MPNHDEHHGHFVSNAYEDWSKDEAGEEHQECHAAHDTHHTEESERIKDNKNGGDIVYDLQDWLNPHDFKCEKIFEPFSKFAFWFGFGFDEEEVY